MSWPFFRSRTRREAELDEEIQAHLAMDVRERVERGEDPEEAEYAARREFGNVARVKEVTREMWGGVWVERLGQDLRIALRSLRRTPGFAATAVLILGLGIGMTTAVFTVYHAVLLRELPVRDQEKLVVLQGEVPGQLSNVGMPYPSYLEFRDGSRGLQDAAAVVHFEVPDLLLRDGDLLVPIQAGYVTGNFFQTLGTRPLLGRLIRPEDDVVGAEPALVLSYATWQERFGGDPGVVGRQVILSGSSFPLRIVGVAPPGLDYPAGTDAWVPILAARPQAASDSTGRWVPLNVVGRIAPDATPAQARTEYLTALRTSAYRRKAPEQMLRDLRATVQPLPQVVLGDVRPVLIALAAAVALLLFIACANIGNLLLVRAAGRTHEMAIRSALGAGYGHLVRQLLTESFLLGLLGGAVGLLLSQGLIRALLALAPSELPRLDAIQAGVVPTTIAIGVTLVSTAFFGLAPALWSARHGLASPLRAGSRGGDHGRGARLARNVLVGWQVALAIVILAGAGLVARSLGNLQRLDPGYRPEGLAIAQLDWPWSFGTTAKMRDLMERIVARVEALPGVVAATPVHQMPFSGSAGALHDIVAEGQGGTDPQESLILAVETAGPDYFRTFGLPILRGRAFTRADREDALPVAILSEAAARRLWPGQDPIGKRLRLNAPQYQDDWMTVVGIVPETRYRAFRTAEPSIYYPYRQYAPSRILAVRTSGPPGATLPSIRRALAEAEPKLGVWRFDTMDNLLGEPLAQPRLNTVLLSAFALAALLLAAIGLYAITATAVRQQTRELGVRIALGATPGDVRRLVIGHAFSVVGIGAVAGLAAALAAARVLRSMLFQIRPTDPATLAGVCALLLAVALLAAYLPAHRATKIDPAQALRAE